MKTRSRLARWPDLALRVASVIVLIPILGAFGLLGYASRNSSQPVMLPAPSGPHQVGRTVYDFVDSSRLDPFARGKTTHREVSVFVWYPAEPGTSRSLSPYLPIEWQQALAGQERPVDGLNSIVLTPAKNIHSHSFDDAPVAAGAHPILLFSPGLGFTVNEYSSVLEDLASRGYVVAGVNATYSANVVLTGGRLVRSVPKAADRADVPVLVALLADDLRFVADQIAALNGKAGEPFQGRLQVAPVGFFGHSVGGAAATQACHDDARCAGAIDLDGNLVGKVATTGVGKPFVFVAHDNAFHDESDLRTEVHGVLQGVPPGDGYVLRVAGTRHRSFTDRALTFNLVVALLRGNGPIDAAKGVRITSALVSGFFDQYLLGQPYAFANASTKYAEVVTESSL